MINKNCGKCGQTKPVEEFYKRKSGQRVGQCYEKCIVCMKTRGRDYYHLNHERQLKLALIRRHRAYNIKRKYINEAKNRACADCGLKYPYFVMDFDHKDRRDKINDVAYMATRNWSLEKIKNEVNKCEVVCANCHRIRTYGKYAKVAKVVTAGL